MYHNETCNIIIILLWFMTAILRGERTASTRKSGKLIGPSCLVAQKICISLTEFIDLWLLFTSNWRIIIIYMKTKSV